MKENFDFYIRADLPHIDRAIEVRVVVKGTLITLYGASSRLCAGIWDAGGYVRYSNSQTLGVHPAILDEVDLKLRARMTVKGEQARVHPRRGSAIGYQG